MRRRVNIEPIERLSSSPVDTCPMLLIVNWASQFLCNLVCVETKHALAFRACCAWVNRRHWVSLQSR